MRKKVVEGERRRAARLFLRVLKLQEKANDVFYHFEFGGHIDGVSFYKTKKTGGTFEIIGITLTHYFDYDFGNTLDEIETAIAEEEKKYAEIVC